MEDRPTCLRCAGAPDRGANLIYRDGYVETEWTCPLCGHYFHTPAAGTTSKQVARHREARRTFWEGRRREEADTWLQFSLLRAMSYVAYGLVAVGQLPWYWLLLHSFANAAGLACWYDRHTDLPEGDYE